MTCKKYFCSLLTALFLVVSIFAQEEDVLQLTPYDGTTASYLVAQIRADTTDNGGVIPEGRVYELVGGEIYLDIETFYVADGQTLHLRSTNEERAKIYLYPDPDNDNQPPGYLFRSRGGDMILQDLAVAGYYELGDDPENGDFTYFNNVQGGFLRTDGEGASIYIYNCIFSNINGQVLRTNSPAHLVRVQDCIFSNLGALSTSNFGAGKGIDLRESSCDSLILQNNTFVNYQDRPIRHYNYNNPLEGTGNIYYGLIEHNTFVNGMGFHGVLSLGSVGDSIIIKNNLFVDAFAAGEDPTDTTRAKEWGNVGENYNDSLGLNKMYWVFAAENDTTEWIVEGNYYAVTDSGQAFFDKYEELSVGTPLSGYIREKLGTDSSDAFTLIDDPGLVEVPDLMTPLMTYYIEVANKTKDTPNSYWSAATEDMDRREITYYDEDLDVSYSVSSPAYISADGFPAGDLNAFPASKAAWELTDIEEEETEGLIKDFALSQNYPNPFNPTTNISFSIPKANHVVMKVYNILGQEVKTLVNQEMAAGAYKVSFDASDIASGVYIYTISAGDYRASKKMMLLK